MSTLEELTFLTIPSYLHLVHSSSSCHQTGLKVAGPTGRFKRALLKKIHQAGGQVAVGDEDVGRVLRQCLWQWGYELTEREYEEAMRGP